MSVCVCVFTSVCTNLMPTQCVRGQPQMAVRAGVCLIGHFLVSLTPAGPLAAPQGATCGVGGPSYAKVWSRVCLVAHFLATGGQWWQRIWVFLQTQRQWRVVLPHNHHTALKSNSAAYFTAQLWIFNKDTDQHLSVSCSTDTVWLSKSDFTGIHWTNSVPCVQRKLNRMEHDYNSVLSKQWCPHVFKSWYSVFQLKEPWLDLKWTFYRTLKAD